MTHWKRAPHPVDIHVGRRVRIARLAAGVSQVDLSKAIGLTFQQVQKYEQGANRISASKLFQIAQVLEAPVSFFFEGLGDAGDRVKQTQDAFYALKEGRVMARAFLAMPRAARLPLVRLALRIAELSA